MLTKKFYLSIGALIVAIVAIAFFVLRSDTSKEPITIYKTVTPAVTPVKVTTAKVTETSTDGEVTDSSTGGHFHEDGTWHAHSHSEAPDPQSIRSENETGTPKLETVYRAEKTHSEAEKRGLLYQQHKQEYIEDLSRWRIEYQKARKEWLQVVEEGEKIAPNSPKEFLAYVASLSDTERKELAAKQLEYVEKLKAAIEKRNSVSQARPIAPRPPKNN